MIKRQARYLEEKLKLRSIYMNKKKVKQSDIPLSCGQFDARHVQTDRRLTTYDIKNTQ